ncbi:hypothetical protein [Vibrio barjaei]|uniref:hypothetical protein n=1 Tax=Vibrio barjaei TaxID=1676683 RepID=UPI002284E0BD|nr:hypothetical protein [Vibrio barjaei]MCY9871809.1 hypothetical protein [Vibrio barjaei]
MNKTSVTLAYALNNGYDSKEECLFHLNNQYLKSIQDKPYKTTFYDEDGTPFKAYPDFWHAESQTAIEYKAHQLNTCKTKADSQQKLDNQQEFRGKVTFFDKLKWGWNHSLYKQAKVQNSLESLGHKMLVVFADETKLSTQNKNKMAKANLTWCWESELPEHLNLTSETAIFSSFLFPFSQTSHLVVL